MVKNEKSPPAVFPYNRSEVWGLRERMVILERPENGDILRNLGEGWRMKQHNTGCSGFLIHIEGTENATWQGTVTIVDTGKRETFRSALELIRLIDEVETQKEQKSSASPGK